MTCDICQQLTYRQTFIPNPNGGGRVWVPRCEKCEPNKPRYERRHAHGSRAPMGYVPSTYPIDKFLNETAPRRETR